VARFVSKQTSAVALVAPAVVTTADADWDAPSTARVRCVVTTLPHTHERGLRLGEVTEVPVEIAALMASKGQVEVL